jgi:hypothetical protein
MAETIREKFFNAKEIGSLWDVAVSLKRGNPLPIDADSVFNSEHKLIEYIGDKVTTVAYPGQIVAVVNEDSTKIFYIDQNLDYKPISEELDAYTKSEIDALEVTINESIADALKSAKEYADGKVYDDTKVKEDILAADNKAQGAVNRIDAVEKAGYQTSSQVSTAIVNALTDYYNKTQVDGIVEELEGAISSIPKFKIEVVESTASVTNPDSATVYLVPDNDPTTADVYDEYIYVDKTKTFELLGKQTLDLSGYATKEYAREQATAVDEKYNDVVDALKVAVGDATSGLVKDVNDLKSVDIANLISVAKQEAITAAANAVPVKSAKSGELAIADNGELSVVEIAQSKVAGLVDALANVYTKSQVDTEISNALDGVLVKSVDEEELTVSSEGKLSVVKIAQDKVTGLSTTLGNFYTKAEVDDILSAATGGESAADVLVALNKYKESNDEAVDGLKTRVDELETRTINDLVGDFLILDGGNSSSNF